MVLVPSDQELAKLSKVLENRNGILGSILQNEAWNKLRIARGSLYHLKMCLV